MPEGLLTLLKFCLMAVLYLFLARVVWVVGAELRGSATAAPSSAEAVALRGKRRSWRLTVVEPATDKGRAFGVDGELTIGRGGGCGVPLPADTFVSQVHARVFERDGDLWIEDLGSTNGTFVNGHRVTDAHRVKRGDHLQIGQTVMEAGR